MLVSVINTSFKLFNKLTIMVQVNNTHTGNFFQVTDKHTRHSKMFQTLAASDETISNPRRFTQTMQGPTRSKLATFAMSYQKSDQ